MTEALVNPDEVVFVYVTAPTVEIAKSIAHKAVDLHLAACANVIPSMISIYRWEGAACEAAECALLLKTQKGLFSALSELIKSLHPYECCCIVAWPLAAGAERFLSWIKDETTMALH